MTTTQTTVTVPGADLFYTTTRGDGPEEPERFTAVVTDWTGAHA